MDIFFSTLGTPKKKRLHYGDFLADVRGRLHRWNQLHRGVPEDYDPMLAICHDIASEASVLYIDEFQLNDVVDISFLSRLIPELLLRHGCVLLATSNRHPSDLCDSVPLLVRIGQPVAELLKLRCHVEAIHSIDYRKAMSKLPEKAYLVPLSAENEAALEARFRRDIAPAKEEATDVRVDEFRLYPVKRCARGVARFSFEELFGRVSSAADFAALASAFHTFYVSGLRSMRIKDRAVVRRLILFIDALYERRCKLFCTAQAAPEALFTGDAKSHDANIQELELLDDLSNQLYVAVPPWNNQREKIYSVLVTAEEEMFMFKRAVSRLEEMQSESYAALKHRPEGFVEQE
jgi:predicted ATPase